MIKIPSWKINELYNLPTKVTKYTNIINISTHNKNSLNEASIECLDIFLNEARDLGWYPFITEVYNNNLEFEYVYSIDKDEYIFELYMLEKELTAFKDIGFIDEAKAKVLQNKISTFKEMI